MKDGLRPMSCKDGMAQHGTRHGRKTRTLCLALAVASLPCAGPQSFGQHSASQPGSQSPSKPKAAGPLAVPARDWAVDSSNNELAVVEPSTIYLRYKMHVIDEKGVMLRDVIESKDGSVARLIERDDRPLTEEEDKAEQDRLNDMIASPGAFQKHIANDVSGKKRAAELIKMLPDAMVYSYAPGQPQIEHPAGEQVVVDFQPNPAWKPPSTAAEALTGLRGRVWIDIKTHHMVRMEGEIFQSVNVGWGMLAHIYPGGQLSIEQAPFGGKWIFTKFTEHITVRALMLKTIRENENVESRDHTRVNEMSYQDAIRLLLATPLPK